MLGPRGENGAFVPLQHCCSARGQVPKSHRAVRALGKIETRPNQGQTK